MEPSPFVQIQVGNTKQKTTVKDSATNPKWEQEFRFLISDPTMQELNVEVWIFFWRSCYIVVFENAVTKIAALFSARLNLYF